MTEQPEPEQPAWRPPPLPAPEAARVGLSAAPAGHGPMVADLWPRSPDQPLPPGNPFLAGRPLRDPASGRTGRRWLLVAVMCVLLAAAAAVTAVVVYRGEQAPRTVVQRYFAALTAGRADRALAYAAVPPHGPFLTNAVLRQQQAIAQLSDVSVTGVTTSGGLGTVTVRYRLHFRSGVKQVLDQVPVIRHGSTWRLSRAAAHADITVTTPGQDRLTLAGARLPVSPVLLFPGALPLDTDSTAIQIDGQPSVGLAQQQQVSEVVLSVTDAAAATLRHSLAHALGACLTGSALVTGCPQPDDTRPVPGSLRATPPVIGDEVTVGLSSLGNGIVDLTGTLTVQGHWQDWDFNNQPEPHSGAAHLAIRARASVANLAVIFWQPS